MSRQSPIVEQLTRLVALGAGADDLGLTELELAALAYDWDLWCRPNQHIPPTIALSEPVPVDGKDLRWGRTWPGEPWRVGLVIGGRSSGKSSANLMHAHREACSLVSPSWIFCAQTAEKAVEIFVEGVLSRVPIWERPWSTAGPGGKGLRLRWPSGAEAVITSAGAADVRGPEKHGAVLTEVIDWPPSVAMSTFNTIIDATRLGSGHVLIDSTPSAGDPIIAFIKEQAEHNPRYWWIRHAAGDNELHVVEGYEADQRARYGGTGKELEEVDGVEADELGMVRRRDIEAARRHLPGQWLRRVVILDPAYTSPDPGKQPDTVGLVSMGEGIDHQLYVTNDKSGVKPIETWATDTVDLYITNHCDCLVIETNRGGQMPTSMVRAMADKRGWVVIVVQPEAKTRYVPGTIYVKEVFAEHDKWTRGELLRDLYKAGRVSHVLGADLNQLEKTLTGWYPRKPGVRSPGDLDALAWGGRELAGHLQKTVTQEGIAQLAAAAVRAAGQAQPRRDLTRLWPQHGGDGRASGSRI